MVTGKLNQVPFSAVVDYRRHKLINIELGISLSLAGEKC